MDSTSHREGGAPWWAWPLCPSRNCAETLRGVDHFCPQTTCCFHQREGSWSALQCLRGQGAARIPSGAQGESSQTFSLSIMWILRRLRTQNPPQLPLNPARRSGEGKICGGFFKFCVLGVQMSFMFLPHSIGQNSHMVLTARQDVPRTKKKSGLVKHKVYPANTWSSSCWILISFFITHTICSLFAKGQIPKSNVGSGFI